MTHTLDAFVQRRTEAANHLDELARVLRPVDPDGADYLKATARRAREGRFVVLLIGCFSSGKSTLLNAMLGQPVLPVKVNPCTAILTEVVHGDEPGIDVVHKGGHVDHLDVDTFVERYQLRTDEDRAGAEASDRFGGVDRAIVRWPLPLLRNGVVLLDTPGLDDDAARTARTLSSLPDADAVIFVLSATRFLTDLERRTLRQDLLPLGLHNLFFPVTMVDLLDALTPDPAAALQRVHEEGHEALRRLCTVDGEDRFEQRFVPLDARSAQQARWDRTAGRRRVPEDTELLERSRLPVFEAELERFLVDGRGRAQLNHLADAVARLRDEARRRAELDRATAETSIDELQARQAELGPRLDQLRAIASRVGDSIDAFVARQRLAIFQDLRAFVAQVEDELPDAVAEFDLGSTAALDLLTPAGRAKVEASLRLALEAWLEERLSDWQAQLHPAIERSLERLRAELAADAGDFDALAGQIVTDFAGGTFAVPGPGGSDDVDPVERWFSLAMGAALLSPGAMAAGWATGYEGALKGAAGRIGVRVAILTLGALLGPVGWAGLVLYLISDAVLLVLTGGGQLRRLRSQVAQRLQGQLVAQVDAGQADLEVKVVEGFRPLRDGLVAAAESEADAVRDLLQRTIAARDEARRSAREREASWNTVLAQADEAADVVRKLAGEGSEEGSLDR